MIFGANLTVGCVKLQLPTPSNHVRHNGYCLPDTVLTPVSIWFIVVLPDNNIDKFHSENGVTFGPSIHNTRYDPVQEELI